jgi:hypothetical protein
LGYKITGLVMLNKNMEKEIATRVTDELADSADYMRQSMLTVFRNHEEGQVDEDIPSVCPECGYNNIAGQVTCWVCGICLDQRLMNLAK